MHSSSATTDEALRSSLTNIRRPAIFLHFFDIHFLEAKGIDRFKEEAFAEARLATRLAVLLADEVLVPGSSYVESSLCSQILDEFQPKIFADHFALVGSGSSFDEFLEEKQSQYRNDQAQGVAYRVEGLGIKLPWRSRRRSATADISRDWTGALTSGAAENLFRAMHGDLPHNIERLWEDVPSKLGTKAFIVENVSPILFDGNTNSIIKRNRLHSFINQSYFGSYAEDLVDASVFRRMRYLESPDNIPCGNPVDDVDYQRMINACRSQGVLTDIIRARGASLLAIRDDPRFAAAYAIAHPHTLIDKNKNNAQTRGGASNMAQSDNKEEKKNDYPRVMIVTALPREAAAVLATFDAFSNAPSHEDDANIYREGQYRMPDGSVRRVLLASLPAMGTDTAATVGANAFRTHPRVEYALMVGIAGACPNPEKPEEHVRLGDVVVSDAKGVFDYGHVKRTSEGDENRGSHQKVSPALLNAYGLLASEALIGQHPWETVLSTALAKEAISPRFHRPAEDQDVLYREVDGAAEIVPHPNDIDRHPGQPRLHGGAIGTADILLKDANLRDQLRDRYGVRAVEMEGSGLQNAAWLAGRQFIVVRGACDYADSHKNDVWQYYAALAAASVARCLIERMPPEWFK